MAKAVWNGKIIAESDEYETVEGNIYFPRDTIKSEFFDNSSTKTICSWKGEASYFTLKVEGQENKDAAWYYPNPKDAANNIKDYVAFWKGVTVTE